jgi:hypothetical protein
LGAVATFNCGEKKLAIASLFSNFNFFLDEDGDSNLDFCIKNDS